MTDWPASLQQVPNQEGFSQVMKPNVIRSSMGYGPDKLRTRTTAVMYNVNVQMYLDYDQLSTLSDFYDANMALTFNWLDFTKEPAVAAVYRFMAPPTVTPLGGLYWVVGLSLEMEG